jgi:hypothetical protein
MLWAATHNLFLLTKGYHMFKCLCFYLFGMTAALLLGATDAPAATITVTNGNDSGLGSLRRAVIFASPGDTINFAPSVTAVNLTSGELVINKNLTISGPGANRLAVQRSTNATPFRIFHIISSTVTAHISGLTISNGLTIFNFVGDDDGNGGGIRSAGVLTLTDCTISANQAVGTSFVGGNGGGVLNESGTMTIMRCTISSNSAQYYTSSSGDCGFGTGGGISNYSGGSLTITNSTISGNSYLMQDSFGTCGGVGVGGGASNRGSMTITNCTISGNSTSGSGTDLVSTAGGGIWNVGNLRIASSTIAYNSASSIGGASSGGIHGFGSTRTDGSIIALNSAPVGPDFTVRADYSRRATTSLVITLTL